jgi:hypothetical protein
MKRILVSSILILSVSLLHAQAGSAERLLQSLGLTEDEIEQVIEVERESAVRTARLRADLDVQKAALARLLLDESPTMRLVERNLRASADIEVQIRLVEIERELRIRRIVGTDRWTRIVQAQRVRREAPARSQALEESKLAETVRDRLIALNRAIVERQEALQDALRERGIGDEDGEMREQLRELQEAYLRLQELIRERM